MIFPSPRRSAVQLVLILTLTLAPLASLPFAMTAHAEQTRPREALKHPSEFISISNEAERSRAIFGEIGKLIEHPRCMNCHPAGDHPLQGDDRHEHMPRVWRGETGHLATNCFGCHTERNVTLHEAASYQSIPGNPRWDVAPLSMAWEEKSLGDICRQLKDVSRNGGRDLAMLQEHMAKDELVGWAWHPGEGRDPAPGDQETAGQLVQAWIDTGAQCPD
ncbi:MAG: Isoquinoline 1-oxidoreductase subunit [Bradyrhizobium sp.]|nr:Isoquinoline 1-oxidoreductase subunit [Bradyrhizobium sp.]